MNPAGIFSPGVPAAFHAAYLSSRAFVDALETLCPSRAAVDRLRASAAWAAWSRRWNLAAYYSLVFKEVAGAQEEVALPMLGLGLVGHCVQALVMPL